jgi:hypothetical protein
MKVLDLLVFYMGIYGISWSIIYAKPLKPLIDIFRNVSLLNGLLTCIVCLSFWVGIPFTFLYFKHELWYTQVLLLFSNVTSTWVLAQFLDD